MAGFKVTWTFQRKTEAAPATYRPNVDDKIMRRKLGPTFYSKNLDFLRRGPAMPPRMFPAPHFPATNALRATALRIATTNALVHATSLTALDKILSSGVLMPAALLPPTARRAVGFSANDVVYTQLLPHWLIRPQTSREIVDVARDAIIELPAQLLVTREDWHASQSWAFGGGKSRDAWQRTESLLHVLGHNDTAVHDVVTKTRRLSSLSAATVVRQLPHDAASLRAIDYQIQNEVTFRDVVNLRAMQFNVFFASPQIRDVFVRDHAEKWSYWTVASLGEANAGSYVTLYPRTNTDL